MKKTDINPTLKVVKINPMQLLFQVSGAEGLAPGQDISGGTAGARRARFSTWEDEEEEY